MPDSFDKIIITIHLPMDMEKVVRLLTGVAAVFPDVKLDVRGTDGWRIDLVEEDADGTHADH